MSQLKVYRTNSEEESKRALNNMLRAATPLSRTSFLRYVKTESLHEVENILGYDRPWAQGFSMAADQTVLYFRSTFRGKECCYFDRDDVQFIFY